MITNGTIYVYDKNKSFGESDAPTFNASYDVFINEETQHIYKTIGGFPQLVGMAKGVVFIWEEVNLDECYFIYNNKRYEIVSVETWRLSGGTFGHMEVMYQ